MRLFWWQQLPLIILIQLLEPNSISHKLYVERPQQSGGRFGRYLCLRQRATGNSYKPKDLAAVSLSNRRIAAAVDGNNGLPTLTPAEAVNDKKPSKQRVAAIVGGVGATILVIVIVVLVYICLMRIKKFIRQSSETASSVPSPHLELQRDNTSPYAGDLSPFDAQNLRPLTLAELEHATSNFSESNIIGEGVFGIAYKGLLLDGSIVAVKRRVNYPVQNFVHKAKYVASVRHRHLVKVIGYYEDRHQQLLVSDYISNGNVGNYLYDREGLPTGKLGMRQRLMIALGAAKGLQHLHSLVPPLLHMRFRTSNILVDENFTAKVSDYGLSNLVMECHHVGSSSAIDYFLDPELDFSKNFREQSDVYSFGVFLLELISGHEAHSKNQSSSVLNLVLKARDSSPSYFVDKTLGEHSMRAAKQMMGLALLCIDTGVKRPSMAIVVQEIEQIQRIQKGYLHSEVGEEIGAVTLGSELFK